MKQMVPITLVVMATLPGAARSADDAGVRFFENRIRPVLVKHCYRCHSIQARDAKKLKGGLYLDSAAGIAAGGDSGPVLIKGKSRDSLLLRSLRHDGLEMPPTGKLSDEVIADFAKWIDMGAPDPRGAEVVQTKREIRVDEGRKWWAFRPLQPVAAPAGRNAIDHFIRQAQEAKGIRPNRAASKERLLRRAYFDLIGLPPSEEQLEAFLRDSSPQAFEKVVDGLLASPAYGERWARHWLDTARYAESGGYEFDGFRPGAYHYRDWVIRALNRDMPYDQFVRLQLAGDQLQPNSMEGAAATGFLVAGPYPGQITAKTVERIRYDQLDDMLMTIGGSMLGLTLGCVRCHEHKYDPIPHQDYYALAATLARTVHGSRSLDPDPVVTQQAAETHRIEAERLKAKLKTYAATDLPRRFEAWSKSELAKQPDAARWQWVEPMALDAERSYLKMQRGGVIAHDGKAEAPRPGRPAVAGNDEQYRLTFHTQQKNLTALRLDMFADKRLPQRGPGVNPDGSFQLVEVTLTARPLDPTLKEGPRTVKLKPVFAAFEDKDQPLAHAVDGKPATAWVVRATAKKDNAAILEFDTPLAGFTQGTELVVELKFRGAGIGRLRVAISAEPGPATWAGNVVPQHATELRALAALRGKPLPDAAKVSKAHWFALFDPETAQVVRAVREHAESAPRAKMAEVYTTVPGGQEVFFLRRGEVENKNGKAEPGFVQVLSRGAASRARTGVDPRVALAEWITDVDHGAGALLARVIVNRIWQHHFGKGIVGTPNDFGVQGERPSHPELLEYLAAELVRGGWKLKPLHRLILLSPTYQQSHEVDPANLKADPENRLLWHFRPRRLEAETIRDALLAVGGTLDSTMYGPSVLDNAARRSIYLRVKRSELIPILTMFDAPEPTQSIGERTVTTVPTQALAMMNSPFVRQQAERLAERIRPKEAGALAASIDRGYRLAFGRSPTSAERARLVGFVEQQRGAGKGAPEATQQALAELCHVLLCLNEFVYID